MAPNASLTDNMMGTLRLPLPAEYQMGGGGGTENKTHVAPCNHTATPANNAQRQGAAAGAELHTRTEKSWS